VALGWVSEEAAVLGVEDSAVVDADGETCSMLPAFRDGCGSGGVAATHQNPDPNLEKQALKNKAEALYSELDFIKKRLDETETRAAAE
jgi:hypothetical protein